MERVSGSGPPRTELSTSLMASSLVVKSFSACKHRSQGHLEEHSSFLIRSSTRTFSSMAEPESGQAERLELNSRAVSQARSFPEWAGSFYNRKDVQLPINDKLICFPGVVWHQNLWVEHHLAPGDPELLLQANIPLKALVFTIATAGFKVYTLLNCLTTLETKSQLNCNNLFTEYCLQTSQC